MSLSLFILSDSSGSRRGLSRAEVYLQACRRIGAVPVSAFVRAVSDTTVNLNHYGVGPRGARALAVALKVTVVTKLELEDNRLKAEGTRYLMKMLQSNTTIESLNISHNQLGLEGASFCTSPLFQDDRLIRELDLSSNRFSSGADGLLGQMLGD
uniref:Leucine rich repeat containing 74A n=1 Tax=Salarias fasciatus TaxID=181472 RepID=A0A672H207_SALFA